MVSVPCMFHLKNILCLFPVIIMVDHDEPPKNEVQKKINSPYDLSSNDNSGNVITQVKFRGDENYEE